MLITSPSFKDGENVPKKFSCDGSTRSTSSGQARLTTGGGNMNPELQIQNVPIGTKSLALIVDDPDATRGGTFTHWLVWNIDPGATVIKEESVPPGLPDGAGAPGLRSKSSFGGVGKAGAVEGLNDFGNIGYGGPCPPRGSKPHHYHFKLYALDAMLSLMSGANKSALEEEVRKHLIAKAELVGLYERQQ